MKGGIRLLKINCLSKKFGDNLVLDNVSLSVSEGEVISILGSSGSGKSTLLRCINMLEKPFSGSLDFMGKEYKFKNVSKDDTLFLRKNIGMVFQNYNLFSHKTALENVMEGLIIVKKITKNEALKIAKEYLDKVGLSDRLHHYPSMLSGGQQQRVAIARSLAINPKLILLDEPTSALDPELVNEVLKVIKDMAKEHITMIIVTHEMNFAYEISDRIIFMDKGAIIEEGAPKEVFNNPKHPRSKQFFAQVNTWYDYTI